MALLNRQVLVMYDVAGPDLWHERLVLFHIHQDDYVVATPDSDIHYEELSLVNSDLKGIRVKPSPNTLPIGVAPGQVYALPAFTAAQIAALRNAGQQVLREERLARGLIEADGRPRADGGQIASSPFQAGQLYWVAAEQSGEYKFGDEVKGVADAPVRGNKSVHVIADGTSIFVECIDGEDRAKFVQRPSLWEHRVLPQEIDALGKPECSLKDAAKKASEVEVAWVLTGPRTAKWCVSYLVIEGLGLEGHHERFRQLCKVDASAWGVQEHFQLSMIIKHALQVDQINGYNAMFCEVIFRRMQTIEFAYAEKARDAESRAIGGRLSLEEQQTFGGLTRQAATLMVCPELLDHVKAEVERDANLAKNLRKAREERELAKKHGKKKGGDEAP